MKFTIFALSLALAVSAMGQQFEVQPRELSQNMRINDPLAGNVHNQRTSLNDQTDVAVTVYNSGRALVRDRRSLKLLPGQVSLTFMDVAEQIMPETVSLKSLSQPGKLRILEQNYEYDLMSPEKLMEKYVGKDVKLYSTDTQQSFVYKDATLLSVNGGPVYQVGDEIHLGHTGSVVLPKIPSELIAKPSLIWLLDNDATDHDVEATYLTGGIDWRADYVLTLNKAETMLDLEGWVTLDNESGATYTQAKLKLVAGDVNVVQRQPKAMSGRGGVMPMMAMEAAAPMVEETFAEYHLYTLPRRTTIKQNQTKQVSLLTAEGVKVTKKYEFQGQPHMFFGQFPPQPEQNVDVFLVFQNEEENAMGMPLPAGIVRVYQEDSEGMLQFAGEDRIKHTPKDEEVKLRLGTAFDVVAERKQMDFQQISRRVTECEYEIEIRNHKESEIVVDVVEHVGGDWEMLNASHKYEKKDAFTISFPVRVPADEDATLRYRVRVQR